MTFSTLAVAATFASLASAQRIHISSNAYSNPVAFANGYKDYNGGSGYQNHWSNSWGNSWGDSGSSGSSSSYNHNNNNNAYGNSPAPSGGGYPSYGKPMPPPPPPPPPPQQQQEPYGAGGPSGYGDDPNAPFNGQQVFAPQGGQPNTPFPSFASLASTKYQNLSPINCGESLKYFTTTGSPTLVQCASIACAPGQTAEYTGEAISRCYELEKMQRDQHNGKLPPNW